MHRCNEHKTFPHISSTPHIHHRRRCQTTMNIYGIYSAVKSSSWLNEKMSCNGFYSCSIISAEKSVAPPTLTPNYSRSPVYKHRPVVPSTSSNFQAADIVRSETPERSTINKQLSQIKGKLNPVKEMQFLARQNTDQDVCRNLNTNPNSSDSRFNYSPKFRCTSMHFLLCFFFLFYSFERTPTRRHSTSKECSGKRTISVHR